MWGTEVLATKEFPVRPFFFAAHNLIEHLLAWNEEDRELMPEVSASLKSTTMVGLATSEAKQQ